ncbi:MAG: TonB-dependent receptor [Geminicoccaceae bacterium]|nr:TonB-dependent receptor [Geminicoccaceae bacterium]
MAGSGFTHVGLAVLMALIPASVLAEAASDDLTLLDLEDLMDIEVTSVSKKAQSVAETPSAIYVLTGEEIRESGYTSIPEALRLVPGVSVARINADKWAIGVRGGQQLFSNKLLVLIDGRSVYWSLYSGVMWGMQDLVLDDIDRIEVIRGPGASVWGANAVNGVINIITKKASQTQGTHGTMLAGSNGDLAGEMRHGGTFGEDGYYRIYGKARHYDGLKSLPDETLDDGLTDGRIGFRADKDGTVDQFSFQGQIARQSIDESLRSFSLVAPYALTRDENSTVNQGFLMGKWDHALGEDNKVSFQAYVDSMHVNDYLAPTEHAHYSTIDLELNQQFDFGDRQSIVWGIGFRSNLIDLKTSGNIQFDLDRADNVFSAFIHDDIEIIADHLTASVGVKFEHNDFTGFEIQPTLRGNYRIDDSNSIWGAVSRAVRTPSSLDRDLNALLNVTPPSIAVPLPTALRVIENNDVDSEEMWAFELGYRSQIGDNLNIDIATFANFYRNMIGLSQIGLNVAAPPPHVGLIEQFDNNIEGHTVGGEISIDYRPMAGTRLRTGYSFANIDIKVTDNTEDDRALLPAFEDNLARNQVFAHLTHDLTDTLQVGVIGRIIGQIRYPNVNSYGEMDVRLAWKPVDGVELSIVGQNLLHDAHKEHGTEFPSAVTGRVERSIYGKIAVDF